MEFIVTCKDAVPHYKPQKIINSYKKIFENMILTPWGTTVHLSGSTLGGRSIVSTKTLLINTLQNYSSFGQTVGLGDTGAEQSYILSWFSPARHEPRHHHLTVSDRVRN